MSWHAILRAALPGRARPAARRAAGHVHRRADVGDAARPPRRALACADRRAAHRARARERLPVVLGTLVSQTLLNIFALVIARHRDVRDGRPASAATSARSSLHASRRSRSSSACSSLPALLRRGEPSRSRRVQAFARRRAARWRRCAPACACSASPRLGAQATILQLARLGPPVASLLRAAGRARPRPPRRARARPPRCCSRSTSPRCCRRRRRTSASSRRLASPC